MLSLKKMFGYFLLSLPFILMSIVSFIDRYAKYGFVQAFAPFAIAGIVGACIYAGIELIYD